VKQPRSDGARAGEGTNRGGAEVAEVARSVPALLVASAVSPPRLRTMGWAAGRMVGVFVSAEESRRGGCFKFATVGERWSLSWDEWEWG